MRTIDLRSDTVTRPTPEMWEAMHKANVGDDVFGEDPTINRLQDRVAELLGKEAALYVPSGTMSNQIAISILTEEGDEVYCEDGCHIFNYEGGAPAFVSRVQLRPLRGVRGIYTREQVEEVLKPDNSHFARGSLIEIENTANRGGGTVWPLAEVRRLSELAKERGMSVHLDGARLWNAAVSSGTPEHVWAQHADTISVCFSKGLGAPVGSALVGSRELIEKAHRIRKKLGGGMRQAGIIAAGALYAVENNRARLAEDHRRAHTLARGLSTIEGFFVDVEHVDTNIILLDLSKRGVDAENFAETVGKRGLKVTLAGAQKVRFVTHLDVNDSDIEEAIAIVTELYGE
ncbi:aminotransferase class I/II-fold pyridoxal phosphate-dependent enzyme [bacterium]|nr:aminotransferase class I/II-fold pyridoxal phosphate-dependent enzyme [bacterium]